VVRYAAGRSHREIEADEVRRAVGGALGGAAPPCGVCAEGWHPSELPLERFPRGETFKFFYWYVRGRMEWPVRDEWGEEYRHRYRWDVE